MMSIDQADTIDFATIDKVAGDLWLTISDHLPWDENEGSHLALLQKKSAYLRFVESGEVFKNVPGAEGRSIVINLVGKFPLSQNADCFFGKARCDRKCWLYSWPHAPLIESTNTAKCTTLQLWCSERQTPSGFRRRHWQSRWQRR
jgi:hypothetical protein